MTSPSPDVLDSSPSPSPIPSPRGLGGLFFSGKDNATPVPEPGVMSDSEMTSPSPLDGSASDSDVLPEEWSESPEDTSSTASRAGSSPGVKLGKTAMRATAAKGVIIGSGMLHRMATRAETLQREAGLYLADAEDAENIGHPLGDIIARRGGVAGKALSPDANDALSAAMGLAGYMSKQIALQMQIQQHERGQAEGPVDV